MDCYERLLNTAGILGFNVIEKHFRSHAKGLCKGNKIGISKAIETAAEKRCVLAEEIAHAYSTTGNILDQTKLNNIKQERQARRVAYEAMLPLYTLIDAYNQGLQTSFEVAEYLEVTEEFLLSALCEYRNKYGEYIRYKSYIVFFSPFRVCDLDN